jgi:hypothetical protein
MVLAPSIKLFLTNVPIRASHCQFGVEDAVLQYY